MKEPTPLSYHWRINLTVPNNESKMKGQYVPDKFNLYVGVDADSMEEALGVIRSKYPTATIWQCNHAGPIHFRTLEIGDDDE